MEFEEMQKIWNEQKGETMYAINEATLHNSVTRKKNAAIKRINKVEIGLMIINSLCSIYLFADALDDPHYWNFIGSAMMMITVVYVALSRHKRKKSENIYDRSIVGELDHAIANTDSIIHFSRMMIIGYLIPFTVFYVGKMIVLNAPPNNWLLIVGMYLLAFILIQWERKKMHIPRKENLVSLKKMLLEE